MNRFHQAYYLTGPTAVGKTAVAVALARELGAEILALDSMTLYRGMDIGTAKPTEAERGGIPHHLIDLIEPTETVSVARYRSWAEEALAAVAARGSAALFVGGTPLYLKVLLRGLFEGPGADPELRAELEAEARRHGGARLHERLGRLDPVTAARLHRNDVRRIVRALEVVTLTGRPLSAWQAEHDRPAVGVQVAALCRPRAVLHDRIERRVEAMFAEGFVEEVRRLREGPAPLGRTARQAVGYAEVLDEIEGRSRREETIARIQARTRQFAKRQETWFRGLAEVRPWPVEAKERPEETARRLARWMREGGSAGFDSLSGG